MQDIVLKAKNGDKAAMEELYKLTCDSLGSYCRQLCGNADDAKEIMQETYLTAFQKLDTYRFEGSFQGWLNTIARNKYYNKIRSEKPQMLTELSDDIEEEDEIYAPENAAERSDVRRIVRDVIDNELNEGQRQVVKLYYYHERTISEIAGELNCPEGTVKTRLYHSRRILKNELIKRGITLGGTVILVRSVLRYKAAAVTASAAAVTSKKSGASAAVKAFLSTLKGKVIAGAAAAVVAGGTAAVVANTVKKQPKPEPPRVNVPDENTEETKAKNTIIMEEHPIGTAVVLPRETDDPALYRFDSATKGFVPILSGEFIPYTFDMNMMKMQIPEYFVCSQYNKNDEGWYLNTSEAAKLRGNSQFIMPIGSNTYLRYAPDDSGDELLLFEEQGHFDFLEAADYIDSVYTDVSLSEPASVIIPIDNTNSPDSPAEKEGKKYTFTANNGDKKISGTLLMFPGTFYRNHIMIFTDATGQHTQEFADIMGSIVLSYKENN